MSVRLFPLILPLILASCSSKTLKDVVIGDDVGEVAPEPPVTDTDPAPIEDTEPTPVIDTAIDSAVIPRDTSPPPLQQIDIALTADDAYQLWIDGVQQTATYDQSWSSIDEISTQLPGPEHVIAIYAWDSARVISGMIAAVWVSGELQSVTGDGQWRAVTTDPGDPDWMQPGYDDSAWPSATVCSPADAAIWGTAQTSSLLDLGAQWTWSQPCRDLGRAWYRLVINPYD